MCEFLIFNTQKMYEKQKNFGNFSATFWQLLDTFIGNFFGIHRQLVANPNTRDKQIGRPSMICTPRSPITIT